VEGWEALARNRRAARAASPPFDTRSVLYDCVCEFIATACAAEPAADDDAARNCVRAIHANWLTTPRDDLRGLAPRDILLHQRSHIDWDLQDRCEQWTLQRAAPPVLSRASAAYRFAGFGTHEIVLYTISSASSSTTAGIGSTAKHFDRRTMPSPRRRSACARCATSG
jgi:hypothetical protein